MQQPVGHFVKIKNIFSKIGKYLGPGFVTGASDDDPSGIGTYSIAAAQYGMQMAWLIPFQLPLMIAIQEMCARIGLVTGKGLAANMKDFFPRYVLRGAILLLIVANVINIGADISIMASSAQLVLGSYAFFWAVILTIFTLLLQVFVPYHVYSKFLVWSALFLLAYVITAFITTTNWLEIIKQTFIPHMHFTTDFMMVIVGFIGTTISPYLFFWQTSHEIEEINHPSHTVSEVPLSKAALIKKSRIETSIGMLFSQLIAFFVVVTCYSTLHLQGITAINSAYDAALALKPLAGNGAFLLFTIGMIGAGLLAIPVLAGSTAYALCEVFGFKASLEYTYKEAPFFYAVIILTTLAGLAMNLININPMKALLYAAVVNGISTVPFIVFIIILANKTRIMGEYKNGKISNILGAITFVLMSVCALLLIFIQ